MKIVCRQIEPNEIPAAFLNDGALPDCFNDTKLPHIDVETIDFWGETHKKVRIGRFKTVKGGKQLQCCFPRSNGKLDLEQGELAARATEHNVKCEKEARFCTGCAIGMDAEGNALKDEKGECVGVLLPLFEHSETTIVSGTDCWKAFWRAVAEAKSAPDNSAWVTTNRVEGALYENDSLKATQRTAANGKSTAALTKQERLKLQNAPHNITNVGKLRDFFKDQPNRRKDFAKCAKGLSLERLTIAVNAAETCLPGEAKTIDYREGTNPHLKRHGVSQWKQKALDTPTMKALTNMRDLVTHMVESGIAPRKGTKHEDNWHFYHDALTMMTSNETLEWMEKKDWLKHWTLPKHDLNKHIKCYRVPRPIGNNPGAMPWDNSLNKDHDDIVLRHVAATALLPPDDPRTFSLATPKECARACRRIYEAEGGIPSKRIVQDILKARDCWTIVCENQGRNVAVNVNGHRGDEA